MTTQAGANASLAELAYEGPPDYREVARHAVSPEHTHDEIERLNFLAQMTRHVTTCVLPFVAEAWDHRAGPAFAKRAGRAPADRHEARRALLDDSAFQTWSALRRLYMEQRQQAGRWTTIRQSDSLAMRVDELTRDDPRLTLARDLAIPCCFCNDQRTVGPVHG